MLTGNSADIDIVGNVDFEVKNEVLWNGLPEIIQSIKSIVPYSITLIIVFHYHKLSCWRSRCERGGGDNQITDGISLNLQISKIREIVDPRILGNPQLLAVCSIS